MGRGDWLRPLPDAERMRATDRWAIDTQGIGSLELMDRAGARLTRVVSDTAPDGPVAIVCGTGNNGGDGLVVARLLRTAGRDVRVLLVGDPERLSDDARANLARLPGTPPAPFSGAEDLEGVTVVVDALLGTGFSGEPRPPAAAAIAAMSAAGVPVVAADVPSGVDASSGEVTGAAVRATVTATFHAAKPGLWINPGKTHAGELRVVDIGIPAGAPVEPPDVAVIDDAVLEQIPRRHGASTKFASGFVLVAGASRGLTGAVVLAARAAMRAGAGYVTACVPDSVEPAVTVRLLEVMTRALADEDGAHTPEGVATVLELMKRGGALVLGPGLGSADPAVAFARALAAEAPVPTIIDASGLGALAGRLGDLRARTAPTILTPHEGELGRLLGVDSAQIRARRLHHARAAADASGAIIVLKGDDTLVVEPGGFAAVSPGATPALATAGTGDVLSGVVGALLAKELDPFTAACAAVRLHALAGRRAAERIGVDGVIASDVIDALPRALAG